MIGLDRLHAVPPKIAARLEAGYRIWLCGQLEAAVRELRAALAQAEVAQSTEGVLGARHLLGLIAYQCGDLAEAWQQHAYVLERSRALGIDIGVASSLHNLGLVAAQEGDISAARDLLKAAYTHYTVMGRLESAAAVRENMRRIGR
jgi:tetratricopeptide (TPR) repeat protein